MTANSPYVVVAEVDTAYLLLGGLTISPTMSREEVPLFAESCLAITRSITRDRNVYLVLRTRIMREQLRRAILVCKYETKAKANAASEIGNLVADLADRLQQWTARAFDSITCDNWLKVDREMTITRFVKPPVRHVVGGTEVTGFIGLNPKLASWAPLRELRNWTLDIGVLPMDREAVWMETARVLAIDKVTRRTQPADAKELREVVHDAQALREQEAYLGTAVTVTTRHNPVVQDLQMFMDPFQGKQRGIVAWSIEGAECEGEEAGVLAVTYPLQEDSVGAVEPDARRPFELFLSLPPSAEVTRPRVIYIDKRKYEERTIMGDEIHIQDVRNSIIVLKSRLDNVRQHLTSIPHLPAESRTKLDEEIRDLRTQLEAIAVSRKDECDAIIEAVERVVQQVGKPPEERKKTILQVSAKGLKDAASLVADVAPQVLRTAERIAGFIVNLG